ncbi:TRAP transporter substrate-binding protein [Bacillus sp. FJAT-29814]|uniref:TRAP transporter substrate-binding protein n=1 Tax=Bacillus sp. FJAT-29814 TaxID=1729688 RepID=UPI00083339F7|nr:TRAP transporter substrate-binding protein [Bacillus sp. FJAT-29814]
MKKLTSIFLVFLMMTFLTACGLGSGKPATQTSGSDKKESKPSTGAKEEATHKLKLSHAAAEAHPFHMGALKFVELVDEKTNGRIQITIFPNRQLGEERENLENVMNGTLDMAMVSTPVMSAVTPVFDSLQLPFLLNTYDLEEQALKTETAQKMLDSLNELGITGLAYLEGGMRHLGNNVREIKKPADLEGLKLRVVQSPLISDIFATLKASPTPMAYGEVYSALQTGVIDGEETNLSTMYAEKHLEVIKHFTLAGQFPFPGVILINNKVLKSIPEKDQKLIKEAAAEATAYLFEQIKSQDEKNLKEVKNAGVKVTELQNVDEFIEMAQPVYKSYTQKHPLIKEFAEEVDKLK